MRIIFISRALGYFSICTLLHKRFLSARLILRQMVDYFIYARFSLRESRNHIIGCKIKIFSFKIGRITDRFRDYISIMRTWNDAEGLLIACYYIFWWSKYMLSAKLWRGLSLSGLERIIARIECSWLQSMLQLRNLKYIFSS